MQRRSAYPFLIALLWLAQSAVASDQSTQVLRVASLDTRDNHASVMSLSPQGLIEREPLDPQLQTPLGSLWKLFIYAYAVDQQLADPGYTCTGNNTEEIYCCSKKGESIDRDTALVRSCGLYFSPARLGITEASWKNYWSKKYLPDALHTLNHVQPATEVPVIELLSALHELPAQQQAQEALLDVFTQEKSDAIFPQLGGRFRVKTWSWHDNNNPAERRGGFAGWLSDGTPIWAGGRGTSHDILEHYARAIDLAFPVVAAQSSINSCVQVNLFSRYAIRSITHSQGQAAVAGELRGLYRVQFANGNSIDLESQGEIIFINANQKSRLQMRVSRDEYIARVIDREASAEPLHAARALAITARTYLLQNAARDSECLSIDDASATQRVAPRAASEKARAIAAWTTDMILRGGPVTYHLDTPAPQRLVWRDAVVQANQGASFETILRSAFPQYQLATWKTQQSSCEPMAEAETWLRQQIPQWRMQLNNELGYQETNHFSVCRLQAGHTHVDKQTRRMFVRGLFSQQERLDIVHEYLHLGFEHFPSGNDENYIETLARRLVLGSSK